MILKKSTFNAISLVTLSMFLFLATSETSAVSSEVIKDPSLEYSMPNVLNNNAQGTPNPTKVWYTQAFKVGNLPPNIRYVEIRRYNQTYRGWLDKTNRTDGHNFLVYEGYIYRPDITLPIPSRLDPTLLQFKE